jgi:hypothetical protein
MKENANYMGSAEWTFNIRVGLNPDAPRVIAVLCCNEVGIQLMCLPGAAVVAANGNSPPLELAWALQQLIDGECLSRGGHGRDEEYRENWQAKMGDARHST